MAFPTENGVFWATFPLRPQWTPPQERKLYFQCHLAISETCNEMIGCFCAKTFCYCEPGTGRSLAHKFHCKLWRSCYCCRMQHCHPGHLCCHYSASVEQKGWPHALSPARAPCLLCSSRVGTSSDQGGVDCPKLGGHEQ